MNCIKLITTGLEKVSLHSNPKEKQCQRMLKVPHSCTHLTHQQSNAKNSPSQASQYVNHELPYVQAGLRKGSGTRDQIAYIRWIIEKTREFQENIYFCFIDYAKALDSVDHNKLWEILQVMEILDHLTCLLRNLDAGLKATVRTGYGKTDWFKIGKVEHQSCILSTCLFNLYTQYIMRNAWLDEA